MQVKTKFDTSMYNSLQVENYATNDIALRARDIKNA